MDKIKKYWPIAGAILFAIIIGIFSQGCASSLTKINKDYTEMSTAAKDFARISAQDWSFGSGIIQGAIPEDLLPKWVFEDLQKIDAWAASGTELTDFQLGYIIGVRVRMAGPIIKAAIEQYAPSLLGIKEVAMVLSFIGL